MPKLSMPSINMVKRLNEYGTWIQCLNENEVKKRLPVRKPASHKGDHGRVCVVAGSARMPGAAALCASAAYRTGAGLVEVCACPEVAAVLNHHLPEAITSSRTDINFSAAKAVVIGPGLGTDDPEIMKYLLKNNLCLIIIDADGINMLAQDASLQCLLSPACILTPHPLEMSRLTGIPASQIAEDPIKTACDFAQAYQVNVLLKGARTVIASPDGNAVLNTTGSAALAKAGSGDVLAGIIAGLAAQGMNLFDAGACGAYLHGKAGEKLPLHGALARDIIEALPEVIDKAR